MYPITISHGTQLDMFGGLPLTIIQAYIDADNVEDEKRLRREARERCNQLRRELGNPPRVKIHVNKWK